MKSLLIVAATLIAGSVDAAELKLSEFGAKAATETIPVAEVDSYLPHSIDIGDAQILVGQSPVERIGKELGAPAVGSLCAQDENTRLSVLPGEAIEEHVPVGTIIIERTASPSQGCHSVPELRIAASPDVPGIGSEAAQLSARFGGSAADGLLAYQNRTMLGDEGENWLLVTTLSYEVRGGVVNAMAISQREEASPPGLSRFKYWSPIVIAEQIDVRSFPNSTGPRRETQLKTFSDYGFTQSDREGGTAYLTDKQGSWMFAITVAEATDERLVLCVLDQALNGGNYRSLSAIGFKDGEEGLLVATAEPLEDKGCKPAK